MSSTPFYKYTEEQLCEPGPVVAKLQQAFGYLQEVKDGVVPSGRSAKYICKATGEWSVHISWRAAEEAFVLVFTGPALPAVSKVSDADLCTIPLFERYVPTAKVYKPFVDAYMELKHTVCNGRPMMDVALEMSGGVKPRRVIVTGFHTGGALAQIAAPILFLMVPSANLRIMTFGSPRVGNKAFTQVVYWLAQYSYRVVLPDDPVPLALLPEGPLTHTPKAIRLGAEDFAADTIEHELNRMASSRVPGPIGGQAEEPTAFDLYFHALEHSKLVPTAIHEPILDKALAKVPVATVERLLFGKPVPLRNVSSVQEVWAEESSSAQSVSNSFILDDDSEQLINAFEEQLCLEEGAINVATGRAKCGTPTANNKNGEQLQAECLERYQQQFASLAEQPAAAAPSSQASPADVPKPTDEAKEQEDFDDAEEEEEEQLDEEAYDTEAAAAADKEDAETLSWYEGFKGEEQLGAMLMRYKGWQAMYVSKAAYHQDPKKFARICGVSKERCRVVADKTYDSNVWVAWHNGTLILTSRGTVTVNAIVQDLRFLSRQMPWLPYFPKARCHMGILDNVLAVTVGAANGSSSKLQEAIDEVVPPGAPVNYLLITGHSLGAGVAQLLGIWAALRWPLADPRVITFGAPRLGNHHYREAFSLLVGNSLRVVNKRDALVRIPPSVRGQHYVHVDTILWLNDLHTVLGHGRPVSVEKTAFNNFEHYLYAYLRAVAMLLPCPRGLADFDEPCPDEDAHDYNKKVKQEVAAALEARQARQEGVNRKASSPLTASINKAATTVGKAPLQVADTAVGVVREGVITVGSGAVRGISAVVGGIGVGVEKVGDGIMAMVGTRGPTRVVKEDKALDEQDEQQH